MTAIERPQTTCRIGPLATAMAAAGRLAPAMIGLYRRRRDRAAIPHRMGCSDAILRDIGLTRAPPCARLDSSAFDEPTVRLEALAQLCRRQAAARRIA